MNDEVTNNTQSSFGQASAKVVLRTLQLFRAGSREFGIFADEIATIVKWRKPTPLPQAPNSVLGVVSVQGRMLTVLNLTAMTGDKAGDESFDDNPHIIALRGDEQLALAVDELGDTVNIPDRDLLPNLETAGSFIVRTLQVGNSEVNILDLKALFLAAIKERQRRKRRF